MTPISGIHELIRAEIDDLHDSAQMAAQAIWDQKDMNVQGGVAHYAHVRRRGIAFEVTWKARRFYKRTDGSWTCFDKHVPLGANNTLTNRQLANFNASDRVLAVEAEKTLKPIRERLVVLRRLSKIVKAYERRLETQQLPESD